MNARMWTVVSALAVLSAGCATHYDMVPPVAAMERGEFLDNPQQAKRLERAMTDGQIADLLDLDVRAKLPTTLAVAKLQTHCSGYQPHLDRIEASELEAWQKLVRAHPQLRGVQPVSNLSLDDSLRAEKLTLRELRVAAARLHCELLLVYMQADSEVENLNDAAALYWTLAGLWLVPGTEVEHKTVMQAIVVDCRTGAILGTATGDSHRRSACPAAFTRIHRDRLERETPAEALKDLQGGCERLLLGIASQGEVRAARTR